MEAQSVPEKAKKRLISIPWRMLRRMLMIFVGSTIAAFGYSLFQVPYNIAAGGVSGLGIIVNSYTGFPAGTFFLLANIPLLILGYFQLGRWRFLFYTLLAVFIFSVGADLFTTYLVAAQGPVTDDILLSSVYAGIIVGIGNGIIFRAGGTMAGTNVIGRIIQKRTGTPLNQVYLYTDTGVIVLAGLIFGWELALYAMLTLFLTGLATDFAMEGPSTVRTATIVTDNPQALTNALMTGLNQGASHWSVTGSYTGANRSLVMCTVFRSQVNDLKHIVATVDPKAFVVIGQAHQAVGGGFGRHRDD